MDIELRKQVMWEWVVEFVDEWGDIHDHERCSSLLKDKPVRDLVLSIVAGDVYSDGLLMRLALVRDYGCEYHGLMTRSYAYPELEDGRLVLPKETEDGQKIPKYLHNQLEKIQ